MFYTVLNSAAKIALLEEMERDIYIYTTLFKYLLKYVLCIWLVKWEKVKYVLK